MSFGGYIIGYMDDTYALITAPGFSDNENDSVKNNTNINKDKQLLDMNQPNNIIEYDQDKIINHKKDHNLMEDNNITNKQDLNIISPSYSHKSIENIPLMTYNNTTVNFDLFNVNENINDENNNDLSYKQLDKSISDKSIIPKVPDLTDSNIFVSPSINNKLDFDFMKSSLINRDQLNDAKLNSTLIEESTILKDKNIVMDITKNIPSKLISSTQSDVTNEKTKSLLQNTEDGNNNVNKDSINDKRTSINDLEQEQNDIIATISPNKSITMDNNKEKKNSIKYPYNSERLFDEIRDLSFCSNYSIIEISDQSFECKETENENENENKVQMNSERVKESNENVISSKISNRILTTTINNDDKCLNPVLTAEVREEIESNSISVDLNGNNFKELSDSGMLDKQFLSQALHTMKSIPVNPITRYPRVINLDSSSSEDEMEEDINNTHKSKKIIQVDTIVIDDDSMDIEKPIVSPFASPPPIPGIDSNNVCILTPIPCSREDKIIFDTPINANEKQINKESFCQSPIISPEKESLKKNIIGITMDENTPLKFKCTTNKKKYSSPKSLLKHMLLDHDSHFNISIGENSLDNSQNDILSKSKLNKNNCSNNDIKKNEETNDENENKNKKYYNIDNDNEDFEFLLNSPPIKNRQIKINFNSEESKKSNSNIDDEFVIIKKKEEKKLIERDENDDIEFNNNSDHEAEIELEKSNERKRKMFKENLNHNVEKNNDFETFSFLKKRKISNIIETDENSENQLEYKKQNYTNIITKEINDTISEEQIISNQEKIDNSIHNEIINNNVNDNNNNGNNNINDNYISNDNININNDDINNDDINYDNINNNVINNDDINNNGINGNMNNKDVNNEEINNKDINNEDMINEDTNNEDMNNEDRDNDEHNYNNNYDYDYNDYDYDYNYGNFDYNCNFDCDIDYDNCFSENLKSEFYCDYDKNNVHLIENDHDDGDIQIFNDEDNNIDRIQEKQMCDCNNEDVIKDNTLTDENIYKKLNTIENEEILIIGKNDIIEKSDDSNVRSQYHTPKKSFNGNIISETTNRKKYINILNEPEINDLNEISIHFENDIEILPSSHQNDKINMTPPTLPSPTPSLNFNIGTIDQIKSIPITDITKPIIDIDSNNENIFSIDDKNEEKEDINNINENDAIITEEGFVESTSKKGSYNDIYIPSINHRIVLQPDEYEIILLLDNREVSTKTDRNYIQDNLALRGINCDTRPLVLGDVTWIAKEKKPNGIEIILDHIVERKRIDDLISSIKDGRFREQKVNII